VRAQQALGATGRVIGQYGGQRQWVIGHFLPYVITTGVGQNELLCVGLFFKKIKSPPPGAWRRGEPRDGEYGRAAP
jgi:hypothetical protein